MCAHGLLNSHSQVRIRKRVSSNTVSQVRVHAQHRPPGWAKLLEYSEKFRPKVRCPPEGFGAWHGPTKQSDGLAFARSVPARVALPHFVCANPPGSLQTTGAHGSRYPSSRKPLGWTMLDSMSVVVRLEAQLRPVQGFPLCDARKPIGLRVGGSVSGPHADG